LIGRRTRVPLLGVDVTPATVEATAAALGSPDAPRLIVGHNLHSVYLFHTDATLAAVYRQADVVLIDGQPLRWCGWLAGRRSMRWGGTTRVSSVDWLRRAGDLWSVARLAVIGGSPESNESTTALLRAQLGTDVRGWHGEQLDAARTEQLLRELAAFRPQLTLIGLGMPLQEHFYAQYGSQLPDGVIALVGGAIDQLNGTQRRAPAWIGQLGFEWLWRLVREPRRLGYRYLVEPFKLVVVLARRR